MKTPKLLLDRLPADFHDRLCNWGEMMQVRSAFGTSPTYDVCRALAKRAGQGAWGSDDPEREVNEADACFIEAAWRNSADRMLQQHRDILRAHYVQRAYWKGTCRALGVRLREYDDILVRAVENFEDFVARYAIVVHNHSQDNLTTV
ncbi:hypothetical protein [Achromobacter xylosoxidans]|uniref:hypothetical protein n=1 Tax=Alcaligenes xylosoxydans xylosoxydans TaxID=85698 RepID=UPI002954CCA4|nr:hypothetical protein [Achromobacter xylosoxidans]